MASSKCKLVSAASQPCRQRESQRDHLQDHEAEELQELDAQSDTCIDKTEPLIECSVTEPRETTCRRCTRSRARSGPAAARVKDTRQVEDRSAMVISVESRLCAHRSANMNGYEEADMMTATRAS